MQSGMKRRVAHSHATVSDEFNDPFSTVADYGLLAGVVAEHSQEAGALMLT
ncbi:hypothetical protein L21SP4_00586 [Kiritimatiella glycovorans]|uniref:Uncharacterized protein n=1 Tax=Kiritimatiella glycovorans TaxID=1307763 RepID=A0A0G3EBM7_9BACT|nr:hypothetical protein L21SP4_00586 [Kiritimatiella glycovorans]